MGAIGGGCTNPSEPIVLDTLLPASPAYSDDRTGRRMMKLSRVQEMDDLLVDDGGSHQQRVPAWHLQEVAHARHARSLDADLAVVRRGQQGGKQWVPAAGSRDDASLER